MLNHAVCDRAVLLQIWRKQLEERRGPFSPVNFYEEQHTQIKLNADPASVTARVAV